MVDFGNGEVERSHLNNTGRLEDLLREGVPVLCTPTRGKRLRTRISAVEVEENSYALIDTHIQENIVALAINGGLLPSLRDYKVLRRNPRYGKTVFDLLLSDGKAERPAEIKSAVFYFPEDRSARYPDTPSLRGRRHIKLLSETGGVMIFVAAHPKAETFKPSDVDGEIARLLRTFRGPMTAVKVWMDGDGRVVLSGEIPVSLSQHHVKG